MTTVLTLTTGGIFIMWLGEQITERGIGNGASLLIFFSIVERIWPETLRTVEALQTPGSDLTIPKLLVVLVVMVLVVAAALAGSPPGRRSSTPNPRYSVCRRRLPRARHTFAPPSPHA